MPEIAKHLCIKSVSNLQAVSREVCITLKHSHHKGPAVWFPNVIDHRGALEYPEAQFAPQYDDLKGFVEPTIRDAVVTPGGTFLMVGSGDSTGFLNVESGSIDYALPGEPNFVFDKWVIRIRRDSAIAILLHDYDLAKEQPRH